MLLGDNTGDRAIMLSPLRFHFVGVGISTGLLVYTYIQKYIHKNTYIYIHI
jgi:hypothetical protein